MYEIWAKGPALGDQYRRINSSEAFNNTFYVLSKQKYYDLNRDTIINMEKAIN